tara:strand:+ start:360 stop:1037 length:678 start_codon:yes stop_codon:yes gene_type:complete
MNLITSYYLCNDSDRQKEINTCLQKNVDNELIENIYLLNDKTYNLDFLTNNSKIKQFEIIENGKLLFKDAIEFINSYCYKDNVILSNSDIYFDNTLELLKNEDFNNKMFCLLRYNVLIDGTKDIFRHFGEPRSDSQDCWIFKSPLRINTNDLNFSFGTLGCDNMFASILHDHGYELYNPSYDIITYHLHNIEERNYTIDDRIHGNYCLIKPHHLNEKSDVRFMEY